MYRFSFVLVILAVSAYLLSPEGKQTLQTESPLVTAAFVKTEETAQAGGITANEWRALIEAEYRAIEAEAVLTGSAHTRKARKMAELAEERETEKIEASHIPSSAAATAVDIDPALTKLSLFDLKSAAQKELARLGCYKAKIDGLWGPKSRGAVAKFNEKTAGNWDGKPSVKLISTLRSAPDNLCETGCSSNNEGSACTVASANDRADEVKNAVKNDTYLPPWMRGAKLASTEPDALIFASEQNAQKNAVTKPRSQKRKAEHQVKKRSRVAGYQRRAKSSNWDLKGWPGTSN